MENINIENKLSELTKQVVIAERNIENLLAHTLSEDRIVEETKKNEAFKVLTAKIDNMSNTLDNLIEQDKLQQKYLHIGIGVFVAIQFLGVDGVIKSVVGKMTGIGE